MGLHRVATDFFDISAPQTVDEIKTWTCGLLKIELAGGGAPGGRRELRHRHLPTRRG